MQLTRLETVLVKAMYLSVIGIILFQALGYTGITSLLFLATFPLVLVLWISVGFRRISTEDLIALGLVLLVFVHVFLNAWITDSQLSFSYLKKYIMFSASVIFLATAAKLTAQEELRVFILRLMDFLTIMLIAFYLLRKNQMHMLNGIVTRYLVFRFTNPNLCGLFLTCVAIHQGVVLFTASCVRERIFHGAEYVVLLFFIIDTEARGAFLATALFLVLAAWLAFRGRALKPISNWMITAILWLPLVFSLLYLSMVNSEWVSRMFSFLVNEGKALTNRVYMWNHAYQYYLRSPIIGAYSQISAGTGESQMHNIHADVLASYGTVPLLLLVYLLRRLIAEKNHAASGISTMYLIGFLSAYLLGVGEAALFSGGLGIYLLAGSFLLLANSLPEESNHEAGVSQQLFQSSSKTAF